MVPVYHRAYRFLAVPAENVGWSMLAAFVPAAALVLAAPALLRFHGEWVAALLAWIGVPVVSLPFTFGTWQLTIPSVSSASPSHSLYPAIVALGGCVLAVALLIPLRRLTPLRVIGGVAAGVCGISGAFFFFAGDRFPYDSSVFAAVWTRAEFVVWLIVPVLFAIVLSPLPLRPLSILHYSAMAVAYGIWFSALRLTLLLATFHFAGRMWMAPAYFLAGFHVDFLYIVGFYSVAVSRATRELRRRQEVWQW